jgi:thymidylate synthase (FAD)
MKTTNKSEVTLINHMGSDISVVNAARVSFDKESDYRYIGFREQYDDFGDVVKRTHIVVLEEQDERLIRYLAKHNHWSPFAHTSIQLRVDSPIFVARQLVKHQVGGVWNEISRRYVDSEPVFYFPDVWRKRSESAKQGSSDEAVDVMGMAKAFTEDVNPEAIVDNTLACYQWMLEEGVAPEQARMILPQNMMTSWYWTGSLMFFHRVYKQRIDDHAQKETQEVAQKIGEICKRLFPVSWAELNG